MDRSWFSIFSSAVLGFSALGFVWSTPPPPAEPPKPEGDWRLLDPITYENLTIFPVVSGSSADTSSFITLEEGLASGEVIVREQGDDSIVRTRGNTTVPDYQRGPSVNQLVLINNGKRPVLLLAGELVSGGKQDRIIAKDRLVAPGSRPLPLDVFCVEHGRWSAGSNFNEAKLMVNPSVREQAAVNRSQASVWEYVPNAVGARASAGRAVAAAPPRVNSTQLGSVAATEAPTQSYRKIYESRQVGGSVDSFVTEVDRRFRSETSGLKGEHVVGVIIAYGGEVAWSDIFASGDLFNHYWHKLLRSYAVEAVARPTLREKASLNDAKEFLRRLDGREKTESEPGVYRWREIAEGSLSQIELDALYPKAITLHRLMVRQTS